MAHPKHEAVRTRYQRCCGYCGVSEIDCGGELTIDHYHPLSAGGDESDENLIYACFRCNVYKGEFWPDNDDLANGRRILHPLKDIVGIHIRKNRQTGWLESLTPTGSFHTFLLRLNRPQLIEWRLINHLRKLLSEEHLILETDNVSLLVKIAVLEAYTQTLRGRLAEESKEGER